MPIQEANRQWMSRPSDERFTSLLALHAHTLGQRQRSIGKVVSSRAITVQPVEGQNDALMAVGPNGAPVSLTNYSFGQLAARAGAPAGYLRELPAPLAADNINYGLHHARDVEEIGVLLTKPDEGSAVMRAVTGPNYGRIWNSTITKQLVDRFGDGVTGDFRVPGEFGVALETVTKENTTLYASDRDMFVFLADEKNRIEVPNRRDGKSGLMARGVYFWNSEVGATTFGMAGFLFDYACKNRTIWGGQDYQELRIRHTSGAPDRWLEQVLPAIEDYSNASSAKVVNLIVAAQRQKVENVNEFLSKRFTTSQSKAIQAAHLSDEQRPIESLWDASVAVTAYARNIGFQDERVKLEREGGKILQLAV